MLCLHCGQPEVAELLEVWAPREFMIETCCEGMHEAVNEFLCEDPKAAAEWLNNLGQQPDADDGGEGDEGCASIRVGLKDVCGGSARRIIDDGGQLVIDWNLEVVPVAQAVAKRFVRDHHRHCPPPAGWRYGAAVTNGSQMIGVVMVGRPVARKLDHTKIVEVNRLCIREDIADGLGWNACSLLYGWSARQAKAKGFEKIVTYTRVDEPGTTLIASGWAKDGVVKGRSWNCPSRSRQDGKNVVDKQRWCRVFAQAPRRARLGPQVHFKPSAAVVAAKIEAAFVF